LIAFSLNLILNGYLSRKSTLTAHNLITLFGVDSLLIELDKCIIFFRVSDNELPRAQYGRYENGQDLPYSSLLKVLKAMDISLEEFFKEGFIK